MVYPTVILLKSDLILGFKVLYPSKCTVLHLRALYFFKHKKYNIRNFHIQVLPNLPRKPWDVPIIHAHILSKTKSGS